MKIIDLTYDLEKNMITYNAPWHPPFSIEQLARIDKEGRETRKVTFGTHTGTHIDAPRHFIENGGTVEKIPIDKLIGPVKIVDFSHLKEEEPVTLDMIKSIEITKKIIFKFGWGKKWGDMRFYDKYPFFSKEAAQYLVSKGVELVGHDTPSPDASYRTSTDDSPVHKIFLQNNVILVEYIANMDRISDYDGWNIVVSPLRLKGADGSPARVFIYKEG
jgi:arylformamidase